MSWEREVVRNLPMWSGDVNNNNGERNPNLGYSESISTTIAVPNVLINTLQEAAYVSNIAPIEFNPPFIPKKQARAGRRRKRMLSSTNLQEAAYGSPIEYSYNPPFLPKPQNMAERRLEKMLSSINLTSSTRPANGLATPRVSQFNLNSTDGVQGTSTMDKELLKQLVFQGPRYVSYKPDPSKCICINREKKTVMCIKCGYCTKGNVVMMCPIHQVVHPGLFVCENSKCKAPCHLAEIK